MVLALERACYLESERRMSVVLQESQWRSTVSVHETCYRSRRYTGNEVWRLLLKTAPPPYFPKVSSTSFQVPSISHPLIEIVV